MLTAGWASVADCVSLGVAVAGGAFSINVSVSSIQSYPKKCYLIFEP
jgi:hypothetical protein